MLKFDLVKPKEDKNVASSYEVLVTTMEGDADNFHYHKLYNFKEQNANDMAWLETVLRWLTETKSQKDWRRNEQGSLTMGLFFGDEMIDFDGTEVNYPDWDLMPQFFKEMNQEEKEEEHERICKHVFNEGGWSSIYQSYWNHCEYSGYPDGLEFYEVIFVDEDKVRWDVKFDIID